MKQKQRLFVFVVSAALLLGAICLRIANLTGSAPAAPSAAVVPTFAAATQEPAKARKQAEEDAKFWAQKERVSSHVTIEHSKEEEEAAQRQQKSLLNAVRATDAIPLRKQ